MRHRIGIVLAVLMTGRRFSQRPGATCGRQRGNSLVPAATSELMSRLGPTVQATANEIAARVI
jgi:hypothetical protein